MPVWAYTSDDPRLWSWILFNITMLVFLIMFIHIYCVGRRHSQQQTDDESEMSKLNAVVPDSNAVRDHIAFSRLRLFCIAMILSYSLWPLQFYFTNITQTGRLFIVCLSSVFEVGVSFMVAIIAHRTFTSYYNMVLNQAHIPRRYYVLLGLYICINGFLTCVFEILSYGLVGKEWDKFNAVFDRWAYVNIASEVLVFIVLFRFLWSIAIIVSKIYQYERERGSKTDVKESRMKQVYLRMVSLCTGLVVYLLLLIASYIAFWTLGGQSVTDDVWWILVHEWLGHSVLFATFYSYLRIKRLQFVSSSSARSSYSQRQHMLAGGTSNISGNRNIGPRLSVTRTNTQKLGTHIIRSASAVFGGHQRAAKFYHNSSEERSHKVPRVYSHNDIGRWQKSRTRNSSLSRSDVDPTEQTEIMSISTNDEARQQYNSYKPTVAQYMLMPCGQIPPTGNVQTGYDFQPETEQPAEESNHEAEPLEPETIVDANYGQVMRFLV